MNEDYYNVIIIPFISLVKFLRLGEQSGIFYTKTLLSLIFRKFRHSFDSKMYERASSVAPDINCFYEKEPVERKNS